MDDSHASCEERGKDAQVAVEPRVDAREDVSTSICCRVDDHPVGIGI